jgi:hypothetical protein
VIKDFLSIANLLAVKKSSKKCKLYNEIAALCAKHFIPLPLIEEADDVASHFGGKFLVLIQETLMV